LLTDNKKTAYEAEVMQNWDSSYSFPLVSVICITYNHEKYIAECLDSILSQKTSFPFEVVLHDDGSTDETSRIAYDYKSKYPSIIKLIIQNENQYSKGIRILSEIAMPACSGEYYAICEGDDYWTYEKKLETQVKFMLENPKVILTCHAAQIIDAKTNAIVTNRRPTQNPGFITTDNIILGDGGLIPTPSIVIRSIIKQSIPEWWKAAHISDYPLALRSTLLGEIYTFNEVWCAYRTNVDGSWSSNAPKTFQGQLEHAARMKNILDGYMNDCLNKNKCSAKVMMSQYYFTAFMKTQAPKREKLTKFQETKTALILIDKILIYTSLKTGLKVNWARKLFLRMKKAGF